MKITKRKVIGAVLAAPLTGAIVFFIAYVLSMGFTDWKQPVACLVSIAILLGFTAGMQMLFGDDN